MGVGGTWAGVQVPPLLILFLRCRLCPSVTFHLGCAFACLQQGVGGQRGGGNSGLPPWVRNSSLKAP